MHWRSTWQTPVALVFAAFLCITAAAQADAQSTETSLSQPKDGSTGPVLHEPSGSYFEIARIPRTLGGDRWIAAAAAAVRRTYQGRRGRLAKADSAEIHKFLIKNFEFSDYTWFGLRYVCPGRVLMWSDGRRHDNGFGVWDRNWTRSGRDFCVTGGTGERGYMPIAYSPKNTWQAIGPNKFFPYYIVEYPAPKE